MNPEIKNKSSLRDTVIIMAGFAVLLASVHYASKIVVPFLLALLISSVAVNPVKRMRKKGIPLWLSVFLVLTVVILLQLILALLLGSNIHEFEHELPEYQQSFSLLIDNVNSFFTSYGLDIKQAGITRSLDPGTILKLVNDLVSAFAEVMSNAVLILLTVMFILTDSVNIPAKLKLMCGNRNDRLFQELSHIVQSTNQYITLMSLISLATGILIWLGLTLIGVDFAILCGFIAFVLNFVPSIGSLLASVPAILLALIQLGPSWALVVAGLYLAINTLLGSILTPNIMGSRLGLSTLAIFLSLIFWGWLLGPVGMLLAVPLTMALRYTALLSPQTRWLGILLGPSPENDEPVILEET